MGSADRIIHNARKQIQSKCEGIAQCNVDWFHFKWVTIPHDIVKHLPCLHTYLFKYPLFGVGKLRSNYGKYKQDLRFKPTSVFKLFLIASWSLLLHLTLTQYLKLLFFSIKNERAEIDLLSLSTAPEEGLILQAQGVYLDYKGKVHYNKKVWYVS